MRARWQRNIIVSILSKKLHELLRILRDDLRELRIAGRDLLQDGFKHLWLLLDDLSQLLELWVIAQEVEISGIACSSGRSATGPSSSSSRCTSSRSSLCSRLEQIDWLVSRRCRCFRSAYVASCWCSLLCLIRSRSRLLLCCGSRGLFLLDILWDCRSTSTPPHGLG